METSVATRPRKIQVPDVSSVEINVDLSEVKACRLDNPECESCQ